MSVRFDEPNLVPCAGLLPAAMLALRIDLGGLVEQRLTLARHGANSGAKALTVIGSMLAGGQHHHAPITDRDLRLREPQIALPLLTRVVEDPINRISRRVVRADRGDVLT